MRQILLAIPWLLGAPAAMADPLPAARHAQDSAALAPAPGAIVPLDQKRLTAAQIDALPRASSAFPGVESSVLSGNPAAAGPYAVVLHLPAHTRLGAHIHRDNRTTLVVSGEWHFGYGAAAQDGATAALGPGSFYTEPAGVAHYGYTGDQPVVLYVTGLGPSDTHFIGR